MSAHAPKTAALLAYDAGILSDAGLARVTRHLAACAVCRDSLVAIRAYEALRREAVDQRWREPKWDAMELRLRHEARATVAAIRKRRAGARHALFGGLAAVAAVLTLVAGGALWPEDHLSSSLHSGGRHAEARDGALLEAVVMLIAGYATADERPLTLDARVAEGAVLATAPQSQIHLRLTEGTGFLLGPETRATLTRGRERATTLTLEQGRVTSEVAPLGERARFEVRAGDWTFAVRGTHFLASRDATGVVTLTVAEGTVEVRDAEGSVASVVGPDRWSSSATTVGVHPSVLTKPVALAAGASTWPVVRVPRLPELLALEIDGQTLPVAGLIAMRASPGPHRGVALPPGAPAVRFAFDALPEGTTLDPLAFGLAPPAETQPASGSMPASAVRAVVTRGMDGLQRCYRTALMRRPELEGHMSLRLAVAPSGRVARATLNSATPLAWLATCVESQARAWRFPAHGGDAPLALDVPLGFSSR
jgi:hypothetical protein